MNKTNTEDSTTSQFVEFYSHKNVFITGASGFVGKVLLEKLLRSTPKIGKIYLLLRERKSLGTKERLENILEDPLFDVVKNEVPGFKQKLFPIRGNLIYDGLGLERGEREVLINEVNVVFHVAATIKFTEKLSDATKINIKGTHELLELCEKMKNLNVIMVTSTAYSFAPKTVIKELFLESPMSPKSLINLLKDIDEETFNEISPKLIGKWPNTYTFTKAVMEDIVKSKVKKLPLGMTRLPIVVNTYKEPVAGWLDNLNGLFGFNMGVSMGLIHVIYGKRDAYYEVMPVDFCVNALLACTFDAYTKSLKNCNYEEEIQPVYNCAFGNVHKTTISNIQDKLIPFVKEYPFEKQIWKNSAVFTTCPFLFLILSFFFHFLPALLLDAATILQRRKPIYVKLYYKIVKHNFLIYTFATKEWTFYNDNLTSVWNKMNNKDKKIFSYDFQKINFDEFIQTMHLGFKKYIMKDNMDAESISKCRRKYIRLTFLHNTLLIIFFITCIYFLWKFLNCIS